MSKSGSKKTDVTNVDVVSKGKDTLEPRDQAKNTYDTTHEPQKKATYEVPRVVPADPALNGRDYGSMEGFGKIYYKHEMGKSKKSKK
jgi:bisphosphoglycerate-dependent phosphoglycerate mutase